VTIKGVDGVATLDAQGSSRVIEIADASTAEFRDLTLTGGSVSDGSAGGIRNWGTLTLQSSTVSGNFAVDDGGGIFNAGTLTLQSSTVSGNTAGGDGDDIFP
jgi:hypothetical protein